MAVMVLTQLVVAVALLPSMVSHYDPCCHHDDHQSMAVNLWLMTWHVMVHLYDDAPCDGMPRQCHPSLMMMHDVQQIVDPQLQTNDSVAMQHWLVWQYHAMYHAPQPMIQGPHHRHCHCHSSLRVDHRYADPRMTVVDVRQLASVHYPVVPLTGHQLAEVVALVGALVQRSLRLHWLLQLHQMRMGYCDQMQIAAVLVVVDRHHCSADVMHAMK